MQPAWQGSHLRCGAPAARRKCFRRRMQRGSPAAITHLRRYAHIVLQRAQNEHRCRRPCYRLARAICRLLLAERDEKGCVIASGAARVRQTGPRLCHRPAWRAGDGGRGLSSKPRTAPISRSITRFPFTIATWTLCGALGGSTLSTSSPACLPAAARLHTPPNSRLRWLTQMTG